MTEALLRTIKVCHPITSHSGSCFLTAAGLGDISFLFFTSLTNPTSTFTYNVLPVSWHWCLCVSSLLSITASIFQNIPILSSLFFKITALLYSSYLLFIMYFTSQREISLLTRKISHCPPPKYHLHIRSFSCCKILGTIVTLFPFPLPQTLTYQLQ